MHALPFVVYCAALLSLAVFAPALPASAEDAVPLHQAIADGIVSARVSGLGGSSGDAIKVVLRRLKPQAVRVTVAPGTVFRSADAAVQDMVGARVKGERADAASDRPTQAIEILDDADHVAIVEAFCMNLHRANPSAGDGFALAVPDTVLGELLADGVAAKRPASVVQAAVWITIDHASDAEMAERLAISPADLAATRSWLAERRARKSDPAPPAPSTPPVGPEEILRVGAHGGLRPLQDGTVVDTGADGTIIAHEEGREAIDGEGHRWISRRRTIGGKEIIVFVPAATSQLAPEAPPAGAAPLSRVVRILQDLETAEPDVLKALGSLGKNVRARKPVGEGGPRFDPWNDTWTTRANWGFATAEGLTTRLGAPDEVKTIAVPEFDLKTLQLSFRMLPGHRYGWLWIAFVGTGKVYALNVERSAWDDADRDIQAYLKDGPRPARNDAAVRPGSDLTSGPLPSGVDGATVVAIANDLLTAVDPEEAALRDVRRLQSRIRVPDRRMMYAMWQVVLRVSNNSEIDRLLSRADALYKDDQLQVDVCERLQQRTYKVSEEVRQNWSKALTDSTGDAVPDCEAVMVLIQQDELFAGGSFDAGLCARRCRRVAATPVPVIDLVRKRRAIEPSTAAYRLARNDALYDAKDAFRPDVWALVTGAGEAGHAAPAGDSKR